jgi:hypothetical protein
MKAKIEKVDFVKTFDTKFGELHSFRVRYNDTVGFYSSKKKDQTTFVAGQEAEFTEEERVGKDGNIYMVIKPVRPQTGNFARQLKREQTKYSGFAVSYVKDLIVADKIPIDQWESASRKIFKLMVDLDKTVEQ